MHHSSVSTTIARPPQQARGRERFEKILSAAQQLLLQRGLSDFSIPELASTLGYTRTSIYHFFPTPYALLNELTRRALEEVELQVEQVSQNIEGKSWQQVIEEVSTVVANFYNQHPIASILILGSVASNESHQAMQLTIVHLGRHVDKLMSAVNIKLPSENPDAKALTVELGTACLRLSYFLHGNITPEYRRECANAMIGYLERVITQQSVKQAP
ncbi:TetR/AcrR family transcriptional regulator [Spongiibacter sp.]|uniref:TetR/AcrR family transcriptional regulator n=1 Tax=Spongiibacter sp. TaxID=2024860 RepID=UPI00356313D7